MTEMAPVGYAGISPKCLLGFNKNHGEEISLRLRTDDLKGFRKYENIKKTLLHELAHMVYSEHNADFLALNKQLNQEAASLDWTKSSSHTLSGRRISDPYEQELQLGVSSSSTGQKLGGASNSLASARASSVFAAYNRFLNSSSVDCSPTSATAEPGPDDGELRAVEEKVTAEPDPDDTIMAESYTMPSFESSIEGEEPDPDDCIDKDSRMMFEPDPDDSMVSVNECDQHNLQAVEDAKIAGLGSNENCGDVLEPDPDDSESARTMMGRKFVELDPDDSSEVVARSSNNSAAFF